MDVELFHEKNPRQSANCQRVEITLRGKGPVIRAEADGADFYAALDLACQKLETRLRRAADRRRVHHGRRTPASVRLNGNTAAEIGAIAALDLDRQLAEGPHVTDLDEHLPGRVVREKHHPATPMTVDQALHEMELVGHDFFLFQCADTGQPTVVYRRHAYDYGLIRLSRSPQNGAGSATPARPNRRPPTRLSRAGGADPRPPAPLSRRPAGRTAPRRPACRRGTPGTSARPLLREPCPPRRPPARRCSPRRRTGARAARPAPAPTRRARASPRPRSRSAGPTARSSSRSRARAGRAEGAAGRPTNAPSASITTAARALGPLPRRVPRRTRGRPPACRARERVIQRWISGSWQARNTASTSSGRKGRSTSRSVRTISVVRSSRQSMSTVTAPWSGVAQDPVDRDLQDDAGRVHARLPVAAA